MTSNGGPLRGPTRPLHCVQLRMLRSLAPQAEGEEGALHFGRSAPSPPGPGRRIATGDVGLSRARGLYSDVFKDRYLHEEIDEHGHHEKSCVDEDARLEIIAADVGLWFG